MLNDLPYSLAGIKGYILRRQERPPVYSPPIKNLKMLDALQNPIRDRKPYEDFNVPPVPGTGKKADTGTSMEKIILELRREINAANEYSMRIINGCEAFGPFLSERETAEEVPQELSSYGILIELSNEINKLRRVNYALSDCVNCLAVTVGNIN